MHTALVRRQRMRADDSGELPVPDKELVAGTDLLGRPAMERMLAACHPRCRTGLEPVAEHRLRLG